MNALQRLIADFLADHPEENYSTIARRGGLPRQTVYALAKRERARQTPRLDTIAKLAKGLQMPEATVHAAAGMTAGYGLSESSIELTDDRTRLLVEIAGDLDEERLESLYRRARMLRDEKREEEAARKRRRRKR